MRLFIGVGVPAEARAALAAAAGPLRLTAQARFVPAELYHVTLAFLGEREPAVLPALKILLQETAEAFPPFPLVLSGFGRFGREADAILFAALENRPELPALSGAVRRRLTEAGQTFDPKPFVPHVTLARKARLTPDVSLPAFSPISFTADAVTLYHSTRVEGELRYVPVIRASLGALRNEKNP